MDGVVVDLVDLTDGVILGFKVETMDGVVVDSIDGSVDGSVDGDKVLMMVGTELGFVDGTEVEGLIDGTEAGFCEE